MAMNICPYCRVQLSRVPKRRTACPSCGRPMCVRKGQLCAEDQARAIDWGLRLQIDASSFRDAREKLSAAYGRQASVSDTVWSLMQDVLQRSSSWHERKMIYFHMARFLWEEKRDSLRLQREAVRMDLANWKEQSDMGLLDLKRVRLRVITAREASCPECRALEGRLFTFDEADSAMPVPVAGCTHEKTEGRTRGWCRCVYGLSFE